MCGAAIIAPLAGLAASMFGGRQQNQGIQSYAPQEAELYANPSPDQPEATLGVNNTDAGKTNQGKSALRIDPIKRNTGIGVAGGGGGSGVNVVGS